MMISYAQNFEDVMLWRALKQVERGFYIDVGANDPVIDSVTQFFYQNNWCGINIEPVAIHWEALQRARIRDINLQCAVGAVKGELKLWNCDVRGWATADEAVIAQHEANGHRGQYTVIPQTTLNHIWLQHVTKDVHFLKIDVEGYEHSVLSGLDFQRFRPWVVLVEATRPNTTEEVHARWEHLLLEAGYLFVYADGINRFYVAEEHSELLPAFRYPPNFLDHFIKASNEQETPRIQMSAPEADTVRKELAQAVANAAAAEARIDSLLNSNSWRITAPLRRLSEFKTLKQQACRQALLRGLLTIAKHTAANPLLRKIAIQFLSRFPALKHRLQHSIRKATPPADGEPDVELHLAHLPPRIRHLYTALQHAWAKKAAPHTTVPPQAPGRRKRLAYVSPLPPARSGIADYSAALLPELARFYDIDVIVEQAECSKDWIALHCGVHDSEWLLQNQAHYDRVLYHIGNSSHHKHMFKLLAQVPGVVVLHDFYLGDAFNYLEAYALDAFALQRGLYTSHGYGALASRSVPGKISEVLAHYPANFEVLQNAQGVIVHSRHSQQLATAWYGAGFANHWSVIPLLREQRTQTKRDAARRALGLKPDEFVVCSFGMMGQTKLNHRLLQAWFGSATARNQGCRLVFVGERQASAYGTQIEQAIKASGMRNQIHITGWTEPIRYDQYLLAADLAVQLRTHSRGETSAAVLDCMNHGLPTIANAHGTFAELPETGVWVLPDDFDDSALSNAIDTLWQDCERRNVIGRNGRVHVLKHHAPNVCADQYQQAIELHYTTATELAENTSQLISHALPPAHGPSPTDTQFIKMAQAVAGQTSLKQASRQLLVDVSATCKNDLKTGIQRVVRALVWSLIQTPPQGLRIEPVYLHSNTGVWHYRYARAWTSEALGVPGGWLPDDPVDCAQGDALLIADFTSEWAVAANQAGVYAALKTLGVNIHFFVYDLLPIQMPHCFPPAQFGFKQWLECLTGLADSAICISRTVAQDLRNWVDTHDSHPNKRLRIDWFHLGADLVNSIPSTGLPPDAARILNAVQAMPSFLMVGTIEPRKGYLQTLHAFTRLWQSGINIKLIIVGREGWTGLPDKQRQTIPEIVSQLKEHPELGKRLLWLEDVSDTFLARIYTESVCLIAASEGEGFGLPLIEAAQHALPVIARDIPVFREVAGDHAFYFKGLEAKDLADALQQWLRLKAVDQQPLSKSMPWQTWAESTQRVVETLQLGLNVKAPPPTTTRQTSTHATRI